MRTRFCLAMVLVMSALAPRGAAAQPCPSPTLSVLLRDQAGKVWQPTLDDLDYLPVRGSGAAWRFQGGTAAQVAGDSVRVQRWWGSSCRMRLDELIVRRGGEEMRLLACIGFHATEARSATGSQHLWIDTPPFRAGTWTLEDARLSRAQAGSVMWIAAERWMRSDGARTCKENGVRFRRWLTGRGELPGRRGLPPGDARR